MHTFKNDYSVLTTTDPCGDELPSMRMSSATGASIHRSWWRRFRALEFLVALVMLAMGGAFAIMPTYIREIPHVVVRISPNQTVFVRDPAIDRKLLPEQVPTSALLVGATGVPVLVNLFINYVLPRVKRVRLIPHDTRDFLLSVALSSSISQLITQFVKNLTGRFRPSFYDMCKWDYAKVWDGVTDLCQDAFTEMEGRRSFPSGHASHAWATLFLLTLYLMGRSRLNCENRDETAMRGPRKMFKLFLCFVPTLVAAWIAVTRSVDNWHHYSDIVVGSIIGAFAAGFGYSYNYGSIFSWEAAGVPYQEAHVLRKERDLELPETGAVLFHRPSTHGIGSEVSDTTGSASYTGKCEVAIRMQ